jgi:O-antigen/teichoic acid export membrane protein
MAILVGVIAGVAIFTALIVALVGQPSTTELASVLLFAATYAVYLLTQTVTQRDGHVVRFSLAEIVRAALALIASIALSPTAIGGTTCILIASAFGNIAAITLTAIRPARPRRPSLVTTQRTWHFGWPLSVWLGVSALTLYVDRLILSSVATPEEVGVYSANADLVVRGLTVVAAPIILTIHPLVMREHNVGHEAESQAILRHWSRVLSMLLAVSVVLIVALGPVIVPFLLGEDSLQRRTLLVLAVGAALWQYALLAHKPYEVRHQTRTIMWFAVAALIMEFVVSSLTVRPLGSLGVAAGLLSSAMLYLLCLTVGNGLARGPLEVGRCRAGRRS